MYMKRFSPLYGAIFAGLMVSACANGKQPASRQDLSGIQKSAAIDVPEVKDIVGDDLRVSQIVRPVQSSASPQALLSFEQLNNDQKADYAFEAVDGDHPCDDARGNSVMAREQCQATSKALSNSIARNANRAGRAGRSAAAELQSLTNEIIDPETFDPQRTIDEIGRGGRLNSLAAQSIGADFLAGPIGPLPDAVDDSVLANVLEDLPPVVLDVTVTQNFQQPGR